jgi:hypothetical protein
MKKPIIFLLTICILIVGNGFLIAPSQFQSVDQGGQKTKMPPSLTKTPKPSNNGEKVPPGPGTFTMDQTISDNAQSMTIAFDGLAFLTGNMGTDSFFPPGKVADFWGFQYLRDNDPSSMGHNTDFLTRASLNMLNILSADQRVQLKTLATSQVEEINQYGLKRFVLMDAFRRLLSNDLPSGTTGLDEEKVAAYSAELYMMDGKISLERAAVMGDILSHLTVEQKSALDQMVGKGMTSWPDVAEPDELRATTRDEKIAVMTYAGDLFSWYAGSVDADVYFCPERQGTYFGSFYLKDAPAVGNPGYSIGTNITADMGKAFLEIITPGQAELITNLVDIQRPSLVAIIDIRKQVSIELRKSITGQSTDQQAVMDLMKKYGELDGMIVYNYATSFSKVGQSLSSDQESKLMDLRKQTIGDLAPKGAYLYAEPISLPAIENTDFLFK